RRFSLLVPVSHLGRGLSTTAKVPVHGWNKNKSTVHRATNLATHYRNQERLEQGEAGHRAHPPGRCHSNVGSEIQKRRDVRLATIWLRLLCRAEKSIAYNLIRRCRSTISRNIPGDQIEIRSSSRQGRCSGSS